MHVEDGLSGGGTGVDADIVAIRCVLFIDDQLNPIQQLKTCRLKFLIQVKKIRDMFFRDDQHVSRVHRKRVIEGDCMFIFQEDFPG